MVIPIIVNKDPSYIPRVSFSTYKIVDIQGRGQMPPPPIEVENNEKFEMEKVLESKRRQNKLEYLDH